MAIGSQGEERATNFSNAPSVRPGAGERRIVYSERKTITRIEERTFVGQRFFTERNARGIEAAAAEAEGRQQEKICNLSPDLAKLAPGKPSNATASYEEYEREARLLLISSERRNPSKGSKLNGLGRLLAAQPEAAHTVDTTTAASERTSETNSSKTIGSSSSSLADCGRQYSCALLPSESAEQERQLAASALETWPTRRPAPLTSPLQLQAEPTSPKQEEEGDEMAQVVKTSPPRHLACNNHHYSKMDSSTDDASSVVPPTSLDIFRQTRGSNYDENILLYAGERASLEQQRPAARASIKQQQQAARTGGPVLRASVRSDGRGAARAPAAERARSAAPMGRFVTAYPASRQPANPYDANCEPYTATSHYSPYAFHVPAAWQRANARSPSPTTAYVLSAGGYYAHQQPATPTIKQARYGYVTAAHNQERHSPAGHFNQSLRSRTIEHIPSMVQVSVEDSAARRGHAHPSGPARAGPDKHVLYGVRLIGPATVGQENPFKPGTELSWEADLMVRLIKRGYPIGDLSQLVAAAKELARDGRSKSCERLSGCAPRASRPASHSRSQGNLEQASGRRQEEGGCAATVEAADAERCKQVWASSLGRAKSVPRSLNRTASGPPSNGDADSLDQLITSIERETSDLLNGRGASRRREEEEEEEMEAAGAMRLHEEQQGGKALASSWRMVERLAGRPSATPSSPVATPTELVMGSSWQRGDKEASSKQGKSQRRLGNKRQPPNDLTRRKSDSQLLAGDKGHGEEERRKGTGSEWRKCCHVQ